MGFILVISSVFVVVVVVVGIVTNITIMKLDEVSLGRVRGDVRSTRQCDRWYDNEDVCSSLTQTRVLIDLHSKL